MSLTLKKKSRFLQKLHLVTIYFVSLEFMTMIKFKVIKFTI